MTDVSPRLDESFLTDVPVPCGTGVVHLWGRYGLWCSKRPSTNSARINECAMARFVYSFPPFVDGRHLVACPQIELHPCGTGRLTKLSKCV